MSALLAPGNAVGWFNGKQAHRARARRDIWSAREVTLTEHDDLAPVNVAVWDSGVDIDVFRGQLFVDPAPTESGAHGIAIDDVGRSLTEWLLPLTAEQREAYPAFRVLINGLIDLQNEVHSVEAISAQLRLSALTPSQLRDLVETSEVMAHYIHGTHVAGIAMRGNPAARLVVARFNDQLPRLPFVPTVEWARQMGHAFQRMADYFRTRRVRVVNMSWGDDVAEIETWLNRTDRGADPAQQRRNAAAIFAIWKGSIESAIRSAPGTLFVGAAASGVRPAGSMEEVPASLRLPNLIGVGAVDQAGDETAFTSHGSGVVHASGDQVDSVVPGGMRLRLSGASMAAPVVANLAAKLFALDPLLTPAGAIDLIRRGATTSDDGRRKLVDQTRSVALLRRDARRVGFGSQTVRKQGPRPELR